MSAWYAIAGAGFLILGFFFVTVAAVGVWRLPDVY